MRLVKTRGKGEGSVRLSQSGLLAKGDEITICGLDGKPRGTYQIESVKRNTRFREFMLTAMAIVRHPIMWLRWIFKLEAK